MNSKKRIAIFGFGKEGISAANYLGENNEISIIDDKNKNEIDAKIFNKLKVNNINYFLGNDFPKKEKFDLLIRSPGFHPQHPKISKLIKRGVPITSPTNIFFEKSPAKNIIGVTGTKGKGTTSSLIYDILKSENNNVFLAGNIGNPALEILPKLNNKSVVILELSSFQLIDFIHSPHIAVVLMITSEHLDWHKDINEYLNAKKSIVKFQNRHDFALINQDFEKSKQLSSLTRAKTLFFSTNQKTNGVYVENDQIKSSAIRQEDIINTSNILLPGFHNLQNICAAVLVALIIGVKKENIISSICSFKGLKHRLQLIKAVNGVKYYNDSYSTTPETTVAAIEAFKNPKILILGGSSKKSDFSILVNKISSDKTIKALLLIGQEAKRIKDSIESTNMFHGEIFENLDNMQSIVKAASEIAKDKDIVILSPACASFGMFTNYEDRGDQFIKAVESM